MALLDGQGASRIAAELALAMTEARAPVKERYNRRHLAKGVRPIAHDMRLITQAGRREGFMALAQGRPDRAIEQFQSRARRPRLPARTRRWAR